MSYDRYTERIRYNGGGAPGTGGGGSGAPTDLSYVTGSAESALSNEKVFGATVFYPPDILANRPSAGSTIVGAIYFATDGGGTAGQGTLYRSDGVSVWERVAIDKEYADSLYLSTSTSAGGDLTGTYPNPTIATDAVTYAKMQNVSATDRLLGRDTAGAGDPEELTVGGGVEFTGGPGIQRSALTGDVTAPAGSNATTIANDAVTYAKMQNVATDRLLGRDTAGSGDTEELTVSNGIEFSGAPGIRLADDGVTFAKMQNIATDSLIGRDTAGTGDPENITTGPGLVWSGAGVLDASTIAGVNRTPFSDADVTITFPTTLLAQIGTLTTTRTVTLPLANTYPAGAHIVIVDSSGSLNASSVPIKVLNIARQGSDTINGGTSWSIGVPYGAVIVGTDGASKWVVVDVSVYLDRQEFTASGNWTMPPNAMAVRVRVVGGGASGASGRLGVTSSERHGGGGGGGGGTTEVWLKPSDIGVAGTLVSVTVGAQQTTVGAARSGAAADGANGSSGNDSSFGTFAVGGGGSPSLFIAAGGSNTDPATFSSSGANSTTYVNSLLQGSFFTSSAGGRALIAAATAAGGGTVGGLPGGGGAGASLTAANATITSLAGGSGNKASITGGTAGGLGANGGNGTASPNIDGGGSGGGGGGNQTSSAANAGTGGDGAAPGGGGGGGGAGTQGGVGTSGAGGKGARGYCVVDTICARQ